jgi:hypothetical protein
MNKYAHVVHSYVRRPRFWIFGGCYLAFAGLRTPDMPHIPLPSSVLFACVVTGLGALHLRRQFATPQAHLMPDFFVPHFVVAVAASALVWIAVPWWEAAQIHVSPLPVISVHALAAVLMAAVVLWPKTIVLIPAAPLLVVWMVIPRHRGDTFALRFMAGDEWGAYWGLIGLAVVGYALAAWRLARLSDMAVAVSDDFSLEQSSVELSGNPWMNRLRDWRDAALDRRLNAGAGRGASIAWRRIPSTISWPELALFSIAIIALVPVGWYVLGEPSGGWVVMTVGTGLMLFAPLSSWRFRCNALTQEFMYPAARGPFLRQILVAMALDFCLWTSVATIVAACGYLILIEQAGFEFTKGLAAHATAMWSVSMLLFGTGLATLRFRAWMPLFVGVLVVSLGLAFFSPLLVATVLQRISGRYGWMSGYLFFTTFATVCVAIGLILTRAAYRHWLSMDLS